MLVRPLVFSTLIAVGSGLAAQSVSVSGFVNNWKGKALSGVQVKLAAAGNTATTGTDGTWSMTGTITGIANAARRCTPFVCCAAGDGERAPVGALWGP